ncbi:oligosaccharide repeat unit polymerase [Mucilaginibacter mallensis]|uniref:Oligosaccharide repeat unit polymerase n=1 Tax=Mucilaginibacter mallensis TaxID=652787 RepID=A0A1H1YMR8_MUCMA|nr:O-antigen polymerase [Mucilaginibacter mallensis]SDT22733.1 oligosaccharide repeat unit polymerase [Mucilaginibacter mallensis]
MGFKIFQPVLLFASVWLFVILLFSFRFSYLLNQDINYAYIFYGISLFFFLIGYFGMFVFNKELSIGKIQLLTITEKLKKRIFKFFYLWAIVSIFEIIASGGVPIVWLFTGSSKDYMDFGIHSIHGLMNALELSLGVLGYYVYRVTKEKKFLFLTFTFFLWNLIIITRQVDVVLIVEVFFVYLLLSDNKLKLLRNILISSLLFVILFGIAGDARSGADNFTQLAQPTDNWPDWLPSGFLWVYIYITTPLNNLLFSFTFTVKHYQFLFPNTLSLLFPSFIRGLIYGPEGGDVSGNLVTDAFNVSSAFASPYQDMGYYGIMLFSVFAGAFTNVVWWCKGIKRIFFRAIIAQILILSIFFNHFFYLPVSFQFVWILIILGNYKNEELPIIKPN